MTNFPSGFAAGLTLRGIPLLQAQPGNVFWLDNSPTISGGPSSGATRCVIGSDNNHGTYQRPFATLNYALSQCLPSNGDIIFVKPGHAEFINGAGTTTAITDPTGNITISAGTTLNLGTGGVAIIGLGYGGLRPVFQFITANTANIPVRAANMSFQNIQFQCNFAAVASAFTAVSASVTASIANTTMTVTVVGSGTLYPGAAIMGTGIVPTSTIISQMSGTTGGVGTYQLDTPNTFASGTVTTGPTDFNIESCDFKDISSSLNLVTVFTGNTTANSCDGFRFANNKVQGLGTTAATTAIKPLSATDRMEVSDNFFTYAVLNNTAAAIAGGANNLTNLKLVRNIVQRPNTTTTSGILMSSSSTACTGIVADNYAPHLASTGLLVNTGTKLGFAQNFCSITGAADSSAILNPAAA